MEEHFAPSGGMDDSDEGDRRVPLPGDEGILDKVKHAVHDGVEKAKEKIHDASDHDR